MTTNETDDQLWNRPCELCDEDGTVDDPLADWVDESRDRDDARRYVLAHGQCGEDAELVLG